MHFIAKGLAALEAEMSQTAGRYSVGDAITFADIFLVPQVYNARRFEMDLSAYPTVVRVDAACMEHPAFVAAHPSQQPDAQAS